ncbi:helicase associated domain-containing protein [Rhodospirillales bacterium]|jgi:hypothetical protein|nr:helicase associated domain-containing protein [Rhodospirillales bacterium]
MKIKAALLLCVNAKPFKERKGHCLVVRGHTEDGYQLGTWVDTQRSKKESLSGDQRQRLNELGFVWKVR